MISVIIPVHNAGKFLRESVGSALEQSEVSTVLLIEDGSMDDSMAVCASLARESNRVSVLHHPDNGNHGPGASRNLGISSATTDLVAFLDADDYYLPGRFRKAVSILSANPDVDGVYEAVEESGPSLDSPSLITLVSLVPPEQLLRTLVVGNRGSIHLNGITVRRTVFASSGSFPAELSEAQDTVWIIKTAATARLQAGELRRPVAILRVHAGNRVTRQSPNRRKAMDRSRQRNKVLLDWAAGSLGTEGTSLVQVFAARRMAEANTAEIGNRLLRVVFKRLCMIWYSRSRPILWVHPAFLAALLPRPPGPV